MDQAYKRANSVRVSRNRGCNESFRAAVDRSYEKDFPNVDDLNNMAEQDQNLANHGKVVMRRSKSGGHHSEERKKNRNSKLLRGLGTMFNIGGGSKQSSKQQRSKKTMPPPDTILTSASSLGSNNSADSSTRVRPPSSVKTSGSDIGDPNWPQHQQQSQQNQMAAEPQTRGGHHYGYHARSHSQPRYHTRTTQNSEVYEYYPTSMMRPGSRVGIADPAQLSSDNTDYDVIQRLQNTHVQPPQPQHQYPPPMPQQQHRQTMYNYYQQPPAYLQQYNMYPHYGYTGASAASIAHARQGSNLSSGSSSTNNNPGRPQRPKSNYYEYEMYNNNPVSFASAASSTTTSSSSQYPSSDLHHPAMYSLPRSSSYGHQ